MLDYIFPLYFKKCTTASPMNTNMEMNPKAFRERKSVYFKIIKLIIKRSNYK